MIGRKKITHMTVSQVAKAQEAKEHVIQLHMAKAHVVRIVMP
jgi:hypothetical protein